MESYLEVSLQIPEKEHDLVIAMMSNLNYDSFNQLDNELLAYIQADLFSEEELQNFLKDFFTDQQVIYTVKELENINWNQKWEENFDPVEVDDRLIVKASFHTITKQYPYTIEINPKMSFGTGHHETTRLVSRMLLDIGAKNKTVFDAGTGTGILAILCHLLDAKSIDACDIDEWPYENSLENFALNNCQRINVKQCIFGEYPHQLDHYDLIIANINKNVLLEEVAVYSKYLREKSYLVLSGFYTHDVEDLQKVCLKHGLHLIRTTDFNNWCCMLLEKK